MIAYLARRFLLAVPTFLLATMLVFGMLRLTPGDALFSQLQDTLVGVPASELEVMRAEFGFDKPLPVQYANFLLDAVRGDLGRSFRDRQPVLDKILARAPVTLELAVLSLLLSLVIAIPIGVISALRQDTPIDYLLRGFAIAGLSFPSFWLGTLAVVLPAMWFRVVPPLVFTPFAANPVDNLKQMGPPALILGLLLSSTVMRLTRTMMLEVLRQDYIRTAWAKGLNGRTVTIRHALKNALIPVVTVVGLQVGFVLGGSVILEQIFSLPGLGRLLIEAITFRDYPVIQGINLLVAVAIILISIAVDASYHFLDPRIRLS